MCLRLFKTLRIESLEFMNLLHEHTEMRGKGSEVR